MLILSLLLACSTKEADYSSPTPTNTEEETLPSYAECFPHIITGFGDPYIDIDAYPINETCAGTHTQDFRDIEHVVFLGDSVTVGTYPTQTDEFYRSILTKKLVEHYNLTAPEEDWYRANYDSGQSHILRSGDFSSCAKLGARTRELFTRSKQLETCFTEDLYDKKLLVIMTMGGNDINVITQNVVQQKPQDDIWQTAQDTVEHVDKGMAWLQDPKFTKGIDIVFANLYEFTDGTGDATACPLADVVNLNVDVDDPFLEEVIMWLEREYFEVAKRYNIDMLFLQENFCGHGFHHDDPTTRCYLGPDAEMWFDNTCLHPNPIGHEQIADMFYAVITAP